MIVARWVLIGTLVFLAVVCVALALPFAVLAFMIGHAAGRMLPE